MIGGVSGSYSRDREPHRALAGVPFMSPVTTAWASSRSRVGLVARSAVWTDETVQALARGLAERTRRLTGVLGVLVPAADATERSTAMRISLSSASVAS